METKTPKTARGGDEQVSIQFSVFLANRVGQLRDLLRVSQRHNLKVLGFSIIDSSEWGVVRIVFSDADKGREVLNSNSLSFTETPVLLVEFDENESVAKICDTLLAAELSVHFAYSLSVHHDSKPVLVMHVDDEQLAARVLAAKGFSLPSTAELG